MKIDLNKGLTSNEVKRLTEEGFANIPVENQSKSIGQIVAGNILTYFNLIFTILAALLFLVGSYTDMAFITIVICNTLIGIIQEIRSKRVLDRLIVLSEPKMKVIRDSIESSINSCELVKGDVVVFVAGNQICADAVVEGGTVLVNESLITGEADEVMKKQGDELLSGSFIVSGSCKAVLTHVGHESYAAKLTMEIKKSRKKQQSEMMKSLDKLVKVIGIIIIPIGLTMFTAEYFFMDYSLKDSIVSTVAALVGMIPEGLYLLASVALVVGIMRLGMNNVLVHEMSCVETLARVDVLCVDKTGTITENVMKVNEIIPLDNSKYSKSECIHERLGDFVNSMDNDNITINVLKEYFTSSSDRKSISNTPFSSVTKYSSATFEDGTFVLGAPEAVLRDNLDKYSGLIMGYSKEGHRVLMYAAYEGYIDGKPLTEPVIPLALILLSNPIRSDAKTTFNYFESQGVEIKVISGDNPVTVSSVSLKAGIKNADKYIDASKLESYEEIENAVEEYAVFGRVSPEQKRHIVTALKKKGKTVAMTGDGVNDVLALKEADCSIAMASGSDAASNAAQIVLLDSNFAHMPSVVFEGRRVVNNIQSSASLFLIKNIFSILMSAFALLCAIKYPLVPSQLSILSVFTIGVPAFILALQPNKSIIKGHFLTNVLLKALPAGITDFIVVALLAIMGDYVDITSGQLSTIAIVLLLTVGMVTLIKVCRPFDGLRVVLCVVMALGILGCLFFIGEFFSLEALNRKQGLLLAVLMALSVPILHFMSFLVDGVTEFVAKHNKNFRKRLAKYHV